VLFLHGSGESGEDVEKVKNQGLPKLLENKNDFPAIVISPQCPNSKSGWNVKDLKSLLDEVISTYPVNKKRIYISGMSTGGHGTLQIIKRYTELFAAAHQFTVGLTLEI